MARKANVFPSSLRHKPTGQARVRIAGQATISANMALKPHVLPMVKWAPHSLAASRLIRLQSPNVVGLPQLNLSKIPGRHLLNSVLSS